MRLYVLPFAPNVMRVQILALEKGLDLEAADVFADRAGFAAVNPFGQAPALQLDDGRILTESLTIAQHLDSMSGAPFLFGDDPPARLEIGMWERRAESYVFNPAVEYGHHMHPMFAPFMAQFPDYARSLIPRVRRATDIFADRLAQMDYVAGPTFTAADITAGLGFLFAAGYGMVDIADWPRLAAWRDGLLDRASMAQARQMLDWFAAVQAQR